MLESVALLLSLAFVFGAGYELASLRQRETKASEPAAAPEPPALTPTVTRPSSGLLMARLLIDASLVETPGFCAEVHSNGGWFCLLVGPEASAAQVADLLTHRPRQQAAPVRAVAGGVH